MKVYYQSSVGKIIDFTKEPHQMLAISTLFDYEWSYTTRNSAQPRIAKFSRSLVSKTVDIMIKAGSREDYNKAITEILEVTDADVFKVSPGRLYVGDSYLSCYFIKSKKPMKYANATKTKIGFTILSENGSWMKETTTAFRTVTNTDDRGTGLDYNFDYPFDYVGTLMARSVVNQSYAPVNFELIIYGTCVNPLINIGGHTYRMLCTVETGQYLTINSMTKKIYLTKIDGEVVNEFNNRFRDSDIFEKIPEGRNIVTWDGSFGFDIKLLEERSEPKW